MRAKLFNSLKHTNNVILMYMRKARILLATKY